MTRDNQSPRADSPLAHLNGPDFGALASAVVEWLSSYYARLEGFDVRPTVDPGSLRAALPAEAPEQPETPDQVIADLEDLILPHLTHWQSPHWFAYFPGNSSPVAAVGDLVTTALGQQGMMWSTSPACTELESHVVDWLVDLLGLPEGFHTHGPGGGVLQDSASSSTFCALVAARELARARASLDRLVVYTSNQTHSSVEKGARLAGFEHIRSLPVDAEFALDPGALAAALARDEADGLTPAFVAATVGTTGSTAIDPVAALAGPAREARAWLHVDAAFAGSAMICPEFRPLQAGIEHADSYTFNPHKWLLTGVDCSVLYVADRGPLTDALSILPEYLRNDTTSAGEVIDYRDWQLPLGRRFRSLRLWMVLRLYGIEALRTMIRNHVAWARDFATRVDADPRFEVLAPVPLSLVCFAHRDGDQATEQLLRQLNREGPALLTHTRLSGRYAIRMAIGSGATERRHVDAVWKHLDRLAN